MRLVTVASQGTAMSRRGTGLPTFNYRHGIGDILQAEGARTGVEIGVQRGIFAAELLSRWPSCRKYVLVDLWACQTAFKDHSNVENSKHVKNKREALRRVQGFEKRTNMMYAITTLRRVPSVTRAGVRC